MSYYSPCPELDRCHALDCYWETQNYHAFFEGYLRIAQETGYPLAECQVGFCYLEGYGTPKDPAQALEWTERAARHGDRDGQFNLGEMLQATDPVQAAHWYQQAALQDHDLALTKCRELGIPLVRTVEDPPVPLL